MEYYSINNLKMMEVIDISTGTKLGYIKDLVIEYNEYKIMSILIPREKSGWFSKSNDFEIEWDKITKIGKDIILVNLNNG
ncbi:PRC-barrel domain protein [Clostridium homopropionicum DSM 5847]|uniref:PRC-barrel domain protein n=1 Tax=Clostridium homopropionicum DSM 5847 TaxID=1121318 RepID=A0A0L6ZBZ9_9CLOT|nr:PRC-barrel domain protein [Clostridium homopropionicum DSM 5847]SFG36910.1 sporulation protein, YlmC/YmxH family [Clostridium homopropionicum]